MHNTSVLIGRSIVFAALAIGILGVNHLPTQAQQKNPSFYGPNFYRVDRVDINDIGHDVYLAFNQNGKLVNLQGKDKKAFPYKKNQRTSPQFFKSIDSFSKESLQIRRKVLDLHQLAISDKVTHFSGFQMPTGLVESQVSIFASQNQLWLGSRIGNDKWVRTNDRKAPITIESAVVINNNEIWYKTSGGEHKFVFIGNAFSVVAEAAEWLDINNVQTGNLTPPQIAQFLAATQDEQRVISPTALRSKAPIAPPRSTSTARPPNSQELALLDRQPKVQTADRTQIKYRTNNFLKPFAGGWQTADNQKYYVYPSTKKERQACIIVENGNTQDLQIGVANGNTTGTDINVGTSRLFKTQNANTIALRLPNSESLVPLYASAIEAKITPGNLEMMQQVGCMTSFPDVAK